MRASSAPERWPAYHQPNRQARLRLFCFPHAGGGASAFRRWPKALGSAAEVCPVQFPGRESRFAEPPCNRLAPLVHTLAEEMRAYLDRPFALFGHSMGALLAFEFARHLRRRHGLMPVHLFVAGYAAPQVPIDGRPIHGLPEPAFWQELGRFNGTPREVLERADLREFFLPLLRADFAVCETYAYSVEPPLDCPISAFGGLRDDAVSREQLEAWREQTNAAFRLRMLAGDHFFPQTAQALLLELLCQDLQGAALRSAGR